MGEFDQILTPVLMEQTSQNFQKPQSATRLVYMWLYCDMLLWKRVSISETRSDKGSEFGERRASPPLHFQGAPLEFSCSGWALAEPVYQRQAAWPDELSIY